MESRIFNYSCLLLIATLSACAPRRDLVYFSNMAANTTTIVNPQEQDPHIRQNDIVSITMNSLSPESDVLFASNKNISSDATLKRDGYLVTKNGTIYIPLIGNFKIEGMTSEEAQTAIATELSTSVKNPQVTVRIVNFKITVIGEVNKPSTFIVPDEQINVLEALGLAGDMTVYGKRENVLIIRNDGKIKTMKRLDLNNKEVFNSPFFYLKQNDIVYVEPDGSKAVEYSQNIRLIPLITAGISALAVLAAVLLKR